MSDGPYSIGSREWNGLSKLIEECGEVIQVAGKIIGNSGRLTHWEGSNLRDRLEEEIGDLQAAIIFVQRHNNISPAKRASQKIDLFEDWNKNQQ